jgi:hypothetical protein
MTATSRCYRLFRREVLERLRASDYPPTMNDTHLSGRRDARRAPRVQRSMRGAAGKSMSG